MKRADPSASRATSWWPRFGICLPSAVRALVVFLLGQAAHVGAQPLTASRVGDLRAGTTGSEPQELTNFNGVLYFTVDDGINGRELWKSDPKTGETKIVADINPGAASSAPTGLTVFGGLLVFAATEPVAGRELWAHSPLLGKTSLLKDINPGSGNSAPENFTVTAGVVLTFTADDGARGREMWAYTPWDGTIEIVQDITPGPSDPHGDTPPTQLTPVGEYLFFVANDGSTGYELWVADLGVDAPRRVIDLKPGSDSSLPADLVNFNGTLFFTAADPAVAPGRRLWKSDGTAAGTVLVNPNVIVNVEAGTRHTLVAVDKQLFFSGTLSPTDGTELFVSDGTSQGTLRVRELYPGPLSSTPAQLTKVFGVLFFSARDGVFADPPPNGEGATGNELWRSDGTQAGTRMVKDIFPTPLPPNLHGIVANNSYPDHLTAADGTLFFAAMDAESTIDGRPDRNLWMSDGTENGTVRVLGLPNKNNPDNLRYVNTTLYFTATDSGAGRELWKLQLPDADGDGLLDKWESTGIDYDMDGTIDLNLAALGARPNHKDVFVEIDYIETTGHSHRPQAASLGLVADAFRLAPVANPDGTTGINLWLLEDEAIRLDPEPLLSFGFPGQHLATGKFGDLKRQFFGRAADRAATRLLESRRLAFRYALFAHEQVELSSSSQGARPIGKADVFGDDILIAIGRLSRASILSMGGTPDFNQALVVVESGTLMHELGHSLGLRDGGGDDLLSKPNYLSVMNYALATRSIDVVRPLDFSRQALPTLNEKDLSEPAGVGGPAGRNTAYVGTATDRIKVVPASGPIDWNLINGPSDLHVDRVVHLFDDDVTRKSLTGFDDWQSLRYNFRCAFNSSANFEDSSGVDHLLTEEFLVATAMAADFDGDGIPNAIDNCPTTFNPDQRDTNGNGIGDVCESGGGVAANLGITKIGPATVVAGTNATFTITVTNSGPDAAANVLVSDNLPATTTFVSSSATGGGVSGGSGNNRTIAFASLGNGASATVMLVARVNDTVPADTVITNTASISSATADPNLGNNSSTFTMRVTTAGGNQPPVIRNVSVDKPTLWPPNHQWVDVTVNYVATDDSGPPTSVLSVTSNEPIDGTGDGDTSPDWEIVDAHHVRLRAEFAGKGDGRVYTITIICRDSAGLTATEQVVVRVPKSQGKP